MKCSTIFRLALVIALCTNSIASARNDILYKEDFEDQVAQNWNPKTNSNWGVYRNDGGGYAYYQSNNNMNGSHPHLNEWSIYEQETFNDITYTVNIRPGVSLSSNPNVDIGLIFGYQDVNNFYYVSRLNKIN